jgi:hypothetical protein
MLVTFITSTSRIELTLETLQQRYCWPDSYDTSTTKRRYCIEYTWHGDIDNASCTLE